MEKPETYLTLSSEYTRQHFMELDRHGNLSILLSFFWVMSEKLTSILTLQNWSVGWYAHKQIYYSEIYSKVIEVV